MNHGHASRRGRRAVVVAAAAALALGGCAYNVKRRVSSLSATVRPPRIVLMPVDVELRELTAGGTIEPQGSWTSAAGQHIAVAVAAELAERGITYVRFDAQAGSADDQATVREIERLHRVLGEAILVHDYTWRMKLPARDGRFDWSLGQAAGALARTQHADYALFIAIRDSYATTGRYAVIVAKQLLRVPVLSIPAGAQVGYASLVDLATGDVVWFNQLSRSWGGLRSLDDARGTVKLLLHDLPT